MSLDHLYKGVRGHCNMDEWASVKLGLTLFVDTVTLVVWLSIARGSPTRFVRLLSYAAAGTGAVIAISHFP